MYCAHFDTIICIEHIINMINDNWLINTPLKYNLEAMALLLYYRILDVNKPLRGATNIQRITVGKIVALNIGEVW